MTTSDVSVASRRGISSQRFRIADVDVQLRAPYDVFGLIVEQLKRREVLSRQGQPNDLIIEVPGDAGASVALSRKIVSDLKEQIATRSACQTLQASAVEHNGHVTALFGSPSWRAIAMAHLIARGYRYVADVPALVDRTNAFVHPWPGDLTITSDTMEDLPRSFRKATEDSRWFVEDGRVVYYTIDPTKSYGTSVRSSGGTLTDMVFLNGAQPHSTADGFTNAFRSTHVSETDPISLCDAILRLGR